MEESDTILRTAPVKRLWYGPNNSLSMSVSRYGAAVDRDEMVDEHVGSFRWIARATSSLPVPLSPVLMSTVVVLSATFVMS